MTTKKNYYQILQVDKKATFDEIKKSYRKLAIEYHPDKTGNDPVKTESFKDICNAYAILSNAEKRKDYDLFGFVDENDISQNDISNLFEKLFSTTRQNHSSSSSFSTQNFYNNFMNIDDILGELDNLDCEIHIMHNMPSVARFENLFNVNKDKFKVNLSSNKKNDDENTVKPTDFINDCDDTELLISNIDKIEIIVNINEIIDGNPDKIVRHNIFDKCTECDATSSNINCSCKGNKVVPIDKEIHIPISPGVNEKKIVLPNSGSFNTQTKKYNELEIMLVYDVPKHIKIKNNHLIVYVDLTLLEVFCGFSKNINIGKKKLK